ncbi:CoA transferase [Quadrisphaera setariae]|uniref:CoA transferase n=1 Tax=Quadrisphaera setariae TaxID=2593304 RepID=UPI001C9C6352|nr:CoA transferase [Quadrisphaera setariae]
MSGGLLHVLWRELRGDPADLRAVRVGGTTGLVSPLPVEALAVASATVHRLAAVGPAGAALEVDAAPPADGQLAVDARHVAADFASESLLRLDGQPAAGGFAPLSRFFPTADGWVRVHANYPHHRAALLHALAVPDGDDERAVAAAVRAALHERLALDVEEQVVAGGGVVAAVRTPQEWAASPMGAALAGAPLVDLRRVGSDDAAAATRLDQRAGRDPAQGVRGARVLDLTRVIAGPTGTRALAAWGADVLRLDPPHLPEPRAQLLETGSGKRFAQLDIASGAGRERLEELLAGADALVHGYRPGALARLGLSEEELAERHPHLVVASLSAWGTQGPWAQRRGFDSIVQAASGVAVMTGAADGSPGALPVQALDHAAGHLLAAAVMRGLVLRRPAGPGGTWHAHVSLAGLARWLLSQQVSSEAARAGERLKASDLERYLVDLPSPEGTVTVVRPLGAPVWSAALTSSAPTWLPTPR